MIHEFDLFPLAENIGLSVGFLTVTLESNNFTGKREFWGSMLALEGPRRKTLKKPCVL